MGYEARNKTAAEIAAGLKPGERDLSTLTAQQIASALDQLQRYPEWKILTELLQEQQLKYAFKSQSPQAILDGYVTLSEQVPTADGTTIVQRSHVLDGHTWALQQAVLNGLIWGIDTALRLPGQIVEAYAKRTASEREKALAETNGAGASRTALGLDPLGGMTEDA